MARMRTLKPEFSTSESITGMDKVLRLHFAMLWTYADDKGRGRDDARLIKGAIWPLDDDVTATHVEAWQNDLVRHGRIVRYEHDGRGYFEVVNFAEHQKPQKPTPTKCPSPDDADSTPVVLREESHIRTVLKQELADERSAEIGEISNGYNESNGLPESYDSPTVGLPPVVVVGVVDGDGDTDLHRLRKHGGCEPVVLDDDEVDQQSRRAARELAKRELANLAHRPDNVDAYVATVAKAKLDEHGDQLQTLIWSGLSATDAAEQVAAETKSDLDKFLANLGTGRKSSTEIEDRVAAAQLKNMRLNDERRRAEYDRPAETDEEHARGLDLARQAKNSLRVDRGVNDLEGPR